MTALPKGSTIWVRKIFREVPIEPSDWLKISFEPSRRSHFVTVGAGALQLRLVVLLEGEGLGVGVETGERRACRHP